MQNRWQPGALTRFEQQNGVVLVVFDVKDRQRF
jgi:hypothetical protein